jgi:hypothetical protein
MHSINPQISLGRQLPTPFFCSLFILHSLSYFPLFSVPFFTTIAPIFLNQREYFMAEKLDSITFSQLADYDLDTLEYARKTIAKEIEKRQGSDLKKLQKQFAKLAEAMGFVPVHPEPSNARGRKRGRPALQAGRQEESTAG